jgi:hypothetical protein
MHDASTLRRDVLVLAVAWLLGSVAASAQADPRSGVLDPERGSAHAAGNSVPDLAFDVVSLKLDTIPSDSSAIESPENSDGIRIKNMALE